MKPAVFGIVAVAVLAIGGIVVWRTLANRPPAHAPAFVGAARCGECHAAEYRAWTGSQHAKAMQPATPSAVLGRFDGARFTQGGVTTTFFRRGDQFVVNTEGADGARHDFPIKYTFGVYPLQQYLVELPAGHVQALALAWDARPASAGGQRWFSLTPGQEISHTDEFHWTGREYNWNYMCADCHSTAVRKNYDARTDEFHTTFAEINVACEACHGPGAAHVEWASYPAWLRGLVWRGDRLPAQLTERRGVRWSIDSVTGNAQRSVPRSTHREVDTCAQCHARRTHFADGYTAGARFLDYYTPLPLLASLYYPDGQQRDEDYNYGSFVQSKMYHMGVTCSDCHDPHAGTLRRPGNQVCAQCHRAATYDTPAHHFHLPGSVGAQCVSCHMPDTAYMQIDLRRDHSIRIPRPDRSETMGTPNACNRCHADKTAAWAAALIRAKYRTFDPGFQRFAGAFAADDRDLPGAADSLASVANDLTEPTIARVSALARLAGRPGAVALQASRAWARDSHPLVRNAALEILAIAPVAQRIPIAAPLLGDSTRTVRQEAAWVLAPAADSLDAASRRAFDAAATEFIASQRYNADRAPSRITLGTFFAQLGRLDDAAAEFRAATHLSPTLTQAYVDLADVLHAQGKESESEDALRTGIAASADDPVLHYALGLSLARAHRMPDALAELRRAAVLAPDDRDVLFALATVSRDAGDTTSALRYATRLVQRYPNDAQARALVAGLSKRR